MFRFDYVIELEVLSRSSTTNEGTMVGSSSV